MRSLLLERELKDGQAGGSGVFGVRMHQGQSRTKQTTTTAKSHSSMIRPPVIQNLSRLPASRRQYIPDWIELIEHHENQEQQMPAHLSTLAACFRFHLLDRVCWASG